MILVIRISGQVNVPEKTKETLRRIRIMKKYSAVLMHPNQNNLKLLKKIRNYVAYGTINHETLKELIEKRGEPLKKEDKIDAEKIISDLQKKPLQDAGLKPFFRLHPPRKGIDSKKHFGVSKGVLGDNKENINELVRRML